MFGKIISLLKDLYYTFFPKTCIFCNEPLTKKERLSGKNEKSIIYERICYTCRKNYRYEDITNIGDNFVPIACYIKDICIALWYPIAKTAIHKFKFQENIRKGEILSQMLCDRLEDKIWIHDIDYIVPVPLHYIDKFKIGYNQCDIIAAVIGKRFNKKVIRNNLMRVVRSKAQHKSSRQDRYKNVRGAFKVKHTDVFDNKKILLIDDVVTTCSTLKECCKVLMENSNNEIYVACLSSGIK